LKLKFGKNERNFPIKLISDAKATEADINQYVTAVKAVRQKPLMKKETTKMRRRQDELVNNYTYTTQDIETNLRKRKKKGEKGANLGFEQSRATIAIEAAKAALSDAKHRLEIAEDGKAHEEAASAFTEAERELEDRLEEEKLVLEKVKNRNDRLTSRSGDQKWAKVNKRNIEKNQKSDLGALEEAAKKSLEANNKFDPFARRKVKPKILWEVGQNEKDESKEAEAPKEPTPNQENKEKERDATPSLVQEHQEKAAALSQSHQFAIDEEVLVQSSFTNGIAGLTAKKPAKKRIRKGLSLSEYQERKTAGSL
jgi:RNA polymerase-associated protein RTF1